MTQRPDGGQQYPCDTSCGFGAGISHRQWLAGLAMASLLDPDLDPDYSGRHATYRAIADEAYAMADAMLCAAAEKEE